MLYTYFMHTVCNVYAIKEQKVEKKTRNKKKQKQNHTSRYAANGERPTLRNSFRCAVCSAHTLSITMLTLISARLNYAIAIKIKGRRQQRGEKPPRTSFRARRTYRNQMKRSKRTHSSTSLEIIIMMCKLNMFWLQNVDNKFYFLSETNYRDTAIPMIKRYNFNGVAKYIACCDKYGCNGTIKMNPTIMIVFVFVSSTDAHTYTTK